MKIKTIRSIVVGLALGLFSSLAHAGPGLQHWTTLRSSNEFSELKKGDQIAYVCNQCKTVSVATVETTEQAMALCKEGQEVACPSCKMKTKVVLKRQRNDPPSRTEVSHVNDKGEDCMFIAKVTDKK
ncbi:MAG: hypothetical protein ABIZ04_07720 [Opitutus sp.]